MDQRVLDKFKDQIYRPGEDLEKITQTMEEQEHRADLIEFLKEQGSSVREYEYEEDEEEDDDEEFLQEIDLEGLVK